MTKPLSAFPYLGGKNWNNVRQIGPWVAAHLPMRRGYAEPFSGMASVLLNRPKSHQEVLNDANEHIVCWWRAVRDQPEELSAQLEHTPYSEAECRRANQSVRDNDHPNEIAKARDTAICLWQGVWGAGSIGRAGWSMNTDGRKRRNTIPDIHVLSERLREVELFCRDAVHVVEHLARYDYFTLYLDPPYEVDCSKGYGYGFDRDALYAALLRQRNACAISGYDGEWDDLLPHGWHKDTLAVKTSLTNRTGRSVPRVEALWMNYPSPPVRTGDLFA